MKIVSYYSHKDGLNVIKERFNSELKEIHEIIENVDASKAILKESKEKTMRGKKLYAPKILNEMFTEGFSKRCWKHVRIDVGTEVKTIEGKITTSKAYREMDFVKHKLGVEVQFGKYAFMVYNVSAKMTIFHNQGIIDCGVEIVPMKLMTQEKMKESGQRGRKMSTGVSYFEQFKTDLEMRGVADIDIPVLVIGISQ